MARFPVMSRLTVAERWHVLGVGAIGGLFARWLKQADNDLVLLGRTDGQEHRDLHFKNTQTGQQTIETFTTESYHAPDAIERLLICTKSFAVESAIAQVRARLSPRSQLLLLINGMGVAERLRDQLPGLSIAIGTTTAACFRDTDGDWCPVADGETDIGWFDERARDQPDWFTSWQMAVPDCRWQSDMELSLLRKLAVNAVINPATALWDIRNGELLDEPYIATVREACREVSSLLVASGAAALASEVETRVLMVAENTAANSSSMRVDRSGRRNTEVEAILGYLLEQRIAAKEQRPHTPLLTDWLNRLRQNAKPGHNKDSS